jgi:hypothetical protein
MLRPTLRLSARGLTRRTSPARRAFRPCPSLDGLEPRLTPAVHVSIIGGVLTAQADKAVNTVTVDHVVSGGKGFAEINGQFFSDAAYNSIRINGGPGGLAAKIHANVKPLTVFAVGTNNADNLGDATNHLQGIQGKVLLENETGSSVVNINDQGDATARTVTVSTVPRQGDTSLGQVSGLGAAAIQWDYHDTRAVNLRLGVGASTVNVQGTGVTTNIFNSAVATVNVGSGGHVAGIQGALNLENEIRVAGDTVNINDQNDATTRTVTMSQITRSGDTSLGAVKGLGAAQITWDYQDTSTVNLNLGSGADNINVLATGPGVTTNITTNIFKNANASVNVGNNGFLNFIQGNLNLENDGGAVSIFINDSFESANQFYDMNVIPGDEFVNTFGQLSSTAMSGTITWDNADTNKVTLFGSSGQDTYNIFAIGSATDIVGGPFGNTFNVGGTGSLGASILGTLTLEGTGVGSVLNLNDQADPNAEFFNFAISTPGTGSLSLGSNPSFNLVFDNMSNGVFLATNGFSTVNDPSGSVFVS